jgi:hypothetical protein
MSDPIPVEKHRKMETSVASGERWTDTAVALDAINQKINLDFDGLPQRVREGLKRFWVDSYKKVLKGETVEKPTDYSEYITDLSTSEIERVEKIIESCKTAQLLSREA